MSWSREQVAILTDEYKKHPCLYAVQSKNYKNKNARSSALQDIAKVLKPLNPTITESEIKTKFHGLKTNFLTEHRKHEQSLKSGTGEDDVYQPTIWYYESMFFILDHSIPRRGTDIIGAVEDALVAAASQQTELSQGDQEQDSDSQGNLQCEESDATILDLELSASNSVTNLLPSWSSAPSSPASPAPNQTRQSSKRKRADGGGDKVIEEATDAIKMISSILKEKKSKPNQTHQKNSFDIFGEFIASKLKEMHPEVATEVEKGITNLIFKGVRESKKRQQ